MDLVFRRFKHGVDSVEAAFVGHVLDLDVEGLFGVRLLLGGFLFRFLGCLLFEVFNQFKGFQQSVTGGLLLVNGGLVEQQVSDFAGVFHLVGDDDKVLLVEGVQSGHDDFQLGRGFHGGVWFFFGGFIFGCCLFDGFFGCLLGCLLLSCLGFSFGRLPGSFCLFSLLLRLSLGGFLGVSLGLGLGSTGSCSASFGGEMRVQQVQVQVRVRVQVQSWFQLLLHLHLHLHLHLRA